MESCLSDRSHCLRLFPRRIQENQLPITYTLPALKWLCSSLQQDNFVEVYLQYLMSPYTSSLQNSLNYFDRNSNSLSILNILSLFFFYYGSWIHGVSLLKYVKSLALTFQYTNFTPLRVIVYDRGKIRPSTISVNLCWTPQI